MLTLADQVDGDDHGIRCLVRDDKGFRWPGKYIDTGLAEKHALGFSDIGITRSDNDIRRFTGEKAKGHGADSLNTPQGHDYIGTRMG